MFHYLIKTVFVVFVLGMLIVSFPLLHYINVKQAQGVIPLTPSVTVPTIYTERPNQQPTPETWRATKTEILPPGVIQPDERCPTASPPVGRRQIDGRWFNYSSKSFQLFVYSALLDDRKSLQWPQLPSAYIRLIAVATRDDVMSAKRINVTLACRLYYHNRRSNDSAGGDVVETKVVNVDQDPKPVGFGWPLNGETMREYIFACPLLGVEKTGVPTAVSVIVSENEHPPERHVESCTPVQVPTRPVRQQGVAICVPVAFGNLDPLRLVEWLELQRLLGVQLIGIYNFNISRPAIDVLRHYAAVDGLVELWTAGYIPNGPSQNILQSTPVVNDCMYRHMHEFKRIAVLDLDEVIIPENSDISRLGELVDSLDQEHRNRSRPVPVNYVFRNSYFFLDIPTGPNDHMASGRWLALLRHRKKVALSGSGYSVKSIIDPQACVNMHNHYCWSVTPGYANRPLHLEVKSTIATNRHYKRCHFNAGDCAKMMSVVSTDDVMLRFRTQLEQAVRLKIETYFPHLGLNITMNKR